MSPVKRIKRLYKDQRYTYLVDVGLFVVLILSFHFLFLGWQALDYWPISDTINALTHWSSGLLYRQSCWCLEHVFGIDIVTKSEQGMIFTPDRHGGWAYIGVITECASLKQWLHWLFLMLIFPGPWKHKAWYIPAGLIVIEWINVVRVCGIFIPLIFWPNSFHITHDYIFKVFFYFMIFLMWILWVEVFVHRKQKKTFKQDLDMTNTIEKPEQH